jgi:hypothetical protein
MRLRSLALLALIFVSVRASADAKPAIGSVPIGGKCTHDDQCVLRSICQEGTCTALSRRRFIPPFYWHQPGDVGYRHITVPPIIYTSNWDREGHTRVLFPFYGGRENYKEHSSVHIFPPLAMWVTKWKNPDGHSFGWMPFIYFRKRGPERILAIPPLLSGYRRDDKKDETVASIALFGYYSRKKDDVWRVAAPLFFDHETATTRTTVAPLAFFRRNAEKSTGVIFPLVWHFSDRLKGRTNLVVAPFFEWESARFGRRERLIAPILAWSKDDDEGVRQFFLLTPFLFHRRDRVRDLDVIPPLLVRWKVHDDQSSGLVAGPFLHVSDPEGSTTSVLPLFWRFADRKARAETAFLFPLFGWHRSPDTKGAFVGPFYGWRTSRGRSWGAGVVPLFIAGRQGPKTHAVVPPLLFAHVKNTDKGTQTTALGPFFYKKNKDDWHGGLFPALFVGKSQGTRYATIPLLFVHRSNAEGTTDVVGPAWGYKGKRGWAAGLFPIFSAGRLDGVSHQVIPPLFFYRYSDPAHQKGHMLIGPYFYHRDGPTEYHALWPIMLYRKSGADRLLISPIAAWKKDAHKETVVVGPYAYVHDELRKSSTHFLFPLGVVHRAPNYKVTVQFPFFWRVQDKNETDTAVFPFYYRIRAPGKSVDAFFPLFFRSDTTTAVTTVAGPLWLRQRRDGGKNLGLFPLFAYGSSLKNGQRSRWLGFPGVFWNKNDMAGHQTIWAGPFYYAERAGNYDAGLLPLAFAWRRGTTSKVLAPLFYHMWDRAADASLTVIGPLYFGHNQQTKKFGLFPLFFETLHGDGGSSTTILPLLTHFRKKSVGSLMVNPLFGWSTYPGGVRAWAGPFYVRRDPQVSSTAIWPLVYFTRDKTNDTITRMVLPLYFDTRNDKGRELQMMTPLAWRYHSVERSVIVGIPLFFDVHSYKESRTTGLLPFFVRNRSNVYKSTTWFFPPLLTWARDRYGAEKAKDVVIFPLVWRFGGKNSTTVAFPLFWDFKRGDARTSVLFPVAAWWKRTNDNHYIIGNMYYRRGKNEKEGSWWCDVFPIVSFGKPRKGDLEWNILEGLVGYWRKGRNRALRIFWLFDIPLEPAPPSTLTWWSSTPASARTEF